MKFSSAFIYASAEYTSYEKFVAAPYFRKNITFENVPEKCEITVSGLGFYRIWINGTEITKGLIAPYISNPDHIIYFDNYDIAELLTAGKNTVAFQLGNGMQNAPGGAVWDFEKARFRGAPRLAFCIEYTVNGEAFSVEADESVKTARSPLYFDDLRSGVRYDARKEIDGWLLPDFDDSTWQDSVICEKPRGEFRLCEADPVVETGEEIAPVSIREAELAPFYPSHQVRDIVPQELPDETKCILYDFGVNKTGYCRLKINGKAGQKVELQFAEHIDDDSKVYYANIDFYPDGYAQRDVYICKGGEEEIFTPVFTYHGFRYCAVIGLEEGQATEDLLTYVVCNSDLRERGSFECSDETANTLQEMVRISDLSNFFYFPTDCPHREKNGWTGDAAVSAEQMLLNFTPEKSYIEWLRNIRAAMLESGQLPGIIPTGTWGYEWGNGPAWDAVLTYLPYYTYIYTGNTQILEENATAILRYLNYISLNRTKRGTVSLGLSDWCPVAGRLKPTREYTDSVIIMNIAKMAAFIFDVLSMKLQKNFALSLYEDIKACVRKYFIDFNTMTADTRCQTSQAMAIFYDVFEPGEKAAAFDVLLEIIEESDEHIDFGLLGSRCLFHVLSDFGKADLAYKMICRRDWPSYGYFLEKGLTALPEDFLHGRKINSLNHHFMGDISNWFITSVAGIKYNPNGDNHREFTLRPAFIDTLDFAKAHFDSPYGRITAEWKREGDKIILKCDFPEELECTVLLLNGWKIEGEWMSRIIEDESFEMTLYK